MNQDATDKLQLHDVLRSLPYFSGLESDLLDEIAQHVRIQRLPAGHTIFVRGEGEGAAPLQMILSGTVRVFLSSLRGREQVLRLFHAGDSFGEVPVFDGGPYPASADAVTAVTLGVLPRAQLLEFMVAHPELAISIVKVMAERLRHFNALIEDLSLRRVISRVAHLLSSQDFHELTQAQMASMIGTTREMVNRSLHRLEDDGIIGIDEERHITVLDAVRLARVIEQG